MSKRAAAVKQRIQQFYFQLTEGCGRTNCANHDCASNPAFKKISSDEAAARAMILFKNKVQLCDKPPFKVPRTDSEEDDFTSTESLDKNAVVVENSKDDFNFSSQHFKNELKTDNKVARFKTAKECGKTLLSSNTDTVLLNKQNTDKPDMSKSSVPAENSTLKAKCKVASRGNSDSGNGNPSSSCDDNINKKLQNIFVTKPAEQLQPSKSKESSSFCETIEDALDLLKQLETSAETNSLIASIKDSLWKVFSTADYLNIFALLKEDIRSQQTFDEDKDIDETLQKNMCSKISMDDLDSEIPATSNTKNPNPAEIPTSSCKSIHPTVNMELVRVLYNQCSGYDQFLTVMLNAIAYLINEIERQLTVKKNAYAHDPNYLNMFVTIIENPAIHGPEALEKTFPSFCKVLSRLPIPAQASLARYWSKFSKKQLQNIIESLQQLITFKVVTELGDDDEENSYSDANSNDAIASASKCLNILCYASILGGKIDKEVDESANSDSVRKSDKNRKGSDFLRLPFFSGIDHSVWVDPLGKELNLKQSDCQEPLVPLSEFINEPLNGVIKIEKDYTNYKVNQHGNAVFSFLHFPFLLNTTNKHTHLFYDNRIAMYSERRRTFVSNIMQGEVLHPYLKINVRRSHIIEDTLIQLEYASESDFKKQLFVEFDKEEGVDEGGVSKEFFQLIIDEIFNPENGVFVYNDDTRLFWFNSHSFEGITQYKLIGIVFGLAIYNNCILDVSFPSFVYKKLLGKKARFEDLEFFQPVVHKSLRELLEYEGNVEDDLLLTFRVEYQDVYGGIHHHDLKETGESISVTSANRQEFVDLYVDWLLNTSVSQQFNAFLSGFDLVVSDSLLKYLFNYKELELLIRGSEEYDFEELQRTTDYDGGFTKSSQTIVDFWEVVHELPDEEKRSLLQFSTGSDKAPVGGLAKLKMVIARNGPDSNRLPTAHTCFNVILLPDYKNKDKLKERLLKAIKYSKGFGML